MAIDKEDWVERFVAELTALGVLLNDLELSNIANELWPFSKNECPATVARDLSG